MPDRRAAFSSTTVARRLLVAASLAAVGLSAPVRGHAQAPDAPIPPLRGLQTDAVPLDVALPDWRHSLTKAITYQTIVVATDQLLYWAIITGTAVSELEFLAANALSGVAYYVAFDDAWAAAGFNPTPDESQVSLGKAIGYRVFDTARVFGVALAVGTPLSGSLEVTAAIAATRTAIYILHDYAWSWAGSRP